MQLNNGIFLPKGRNFLNKQSVLITTLELLLIVCIVFGIGCAPAMLQLPPVSTVNKDYTIGPGDVIQIFVWRNPDVSVSVPVRPDGKISTPLVEDMQASGKTPTELARDLEQTLATYLKDPKVTVIIQGFEGSYAQQIRVVGEATKPQVISYKANMALLDVMIAVGGLTENAAGNRASIIRVINGEQKQFRVRVDDLIRDGDISTNVKMYPGDILIIPEAWF